MESNIKLEEFRRKLNTIFEDKKLKMTCLVKSVEEQKGLLVQLSENEFMELNRQDVRIPEDLAKKNMTIEEFNARNSN